MARHHNSRYDSLDDMKVRICMDLRTKVWRIKRTAGMIVWKIGKYSKNMYGLGTMEDKENRRYDSLEDRKVRICMDLRTKDRGGLREQKV
jgi:hypothetical protein